MSELVQNQNRLELVSRGEAFAEAMVAVGELIIIKEVKVTKCHEFNGEEFSDGDYVKCDHDLAQGTTVTDLLEKDGPYEPSNLMVALPIEIIELEAE